MQFSKKSNFVFNKNIYSLQMYFKKAKKLVFYKIFMNVYIKDIRLSSLLLSFLEIKVKEIIVFQTKTMYLNIIDILALLKLES